jgi:Uma2 family endonuclease
MIALRKPAGMTIAEFQHWTPETNAHLRWHLIDGTPVCMAPASENHGRIQAEAAFLLTGHLRPTRPGCYVVVTPGVVPGTRSNSNQRIPDLCVTCAPSSGGPVVAAPLLIVEILSPSNEALIRANVWAYTTIPEVSEILLLSSTAIEAEILRRGPDVAWQEAPQFLLADEIVDLPSIGFRAPLLDFYRTTSLI